MRMYRRSGKLPYLRAWLRRNGFECYHSGWQRPDGAIAIIEFWQHKHWAAFTTESAVR